MTPEKRLNQVEPIVADVAQKVDRLVDTTGLILNEVSKIPQIEADIVEIKGEIVEIKADIVEIKGEIVEIKADIVEIKGEIVEIRTDIVEIKGEIVEIKIQVARIPVLERNIATVANGVAVLTVEANEFRHETGQRFAFLTSEIADIKQTQQEILALLKAKS